MKKINAEIVDLASLVQMLDNHGFIGRTIRTNYESGMNAFKRNGLLSTLLLLLIWLDTGYSTLISLSIFVESYDPSWLLKLGDISYYLLRNNREFYVLIFFCFRMLALLLYTAHYFDDYQWLGEASRILRKLKSLKIEPLIYRRIRFARIISNLTIVTIVVVGLLFVIISELVHRSGQTVAIMALIELMLYCWLYSSLMANFMVKYYVLCETFQSLYQQANCHLLQITPIVNQDRKYSRSMADSLQTLYLLIITGKKVEPFLKRTYLFSLITLLPIIVQMVNIVFYAGIRVHFRLLMVAQIGYFTMGLALFSMLAGGIETKAKMASDQLYRQVTFVNESNTNRSFEQSILHYFNLVYESNLSIDLFGNAINSSTFIKIITVSLSMVTFMPKPFQQ